MPGRMTRRSLRRRMAAGLGVLTVCFLVWPARADLALYGGDERTREHLRALLTTELTPEQWRYRDLVVTVGAEALADFCKSGSSTPVIATYLYGNQLPLASENCTSTVAVIPVDPSANVLHRLARALFPDSTTAMLVADGSEADMIDSPVLQLPVPKDGVARGLGRLISDGHWDAFLMPVDPQVYRGTDYRLALETLFRHRKPAIVSIPSLLSQGAVAAAYYTPAMLDAALRETLRHWVQSGSLVATRPSEVQVKVNQTVLRNGFGRVLADQEERALEAEVNSGE